MSFNAQLKMAILISGKTQFAVAKAAGMDHTRLSRIINGHTDPTDEERQALSGILGKPVSELFPGVAA